MLAVILSLPPAPLHNQTDPWRIIYPLLLMVWLSEVLPLRFHNSINFVLSLSSERLDRQSNNDGFWLGSSIFISYVLAGARWRFNSRPECVSGDAKDSNLKAFNILLFYGMDNLMLWETPKVWAHIKLKFHWTRGNYV